MKKAHSFFGFPVDGHHYPLHMSPPPSLSELLRATLTLSRKKIALALVVMVMMGSLTTCTKAEKRPTAADECLSAMIDAAIHGDTEAGLSAQSEWERVIKETGSSEKCISYTELDQLSRFISLQAEGAWLTNELRLCVGELALNRVASPEFPNDIKGVALDYGVTEEEYAAARPSRACVNAARELLQGRRLLSPAVLYMTGKKEGSVYATFFSRLRGYTYFLTAQ